MVTPSRSEGEPASAIFGQDVTPLCAWAAYRVTDTTGSRVWVGSTTTRGMLVAGGKKALMNVMNVTQS